MNVSVNSSDPLHEDSLFSPNRWTAVVVLKILGAQNKKGNLYNLGMMVQAVLDRAMSNLDLRWVGCLWMTFRRSFQPSLFFDAFWPTLNMGKL